MMAIHEASESHLFSFPVIIGCACTLATAALPSKALDRHRIGANHMHRSCCPWWRMMACRRIGSNHILFWRSVICVVNCHQAVLPRAQRYPTEADNSGEPTKPHRFPGQSGL